MLGCVVHAQSLPYVPLPSAGETLTTLAAAIDAAWLRTALPAEAQGATRRAAAERTAADALWAAPPSLELSHRTDRLNANTGVRETEFGVAVPVWLPGQRAARQSVASTQTELAELMRHRSRLDIAGAVREQLWEVVQLRSETGALVAQVAALSSLSTDVGRRVRAGDLAHTDALAAQSELLFAQSALTTAEARLQTAVAQWQALTGFLVLPSTTDADIESSEGRLSENNPVLRLAVMQVDAARRKLDLASATRRGTPEVVARVRQDVGGHGASSVNSIGVAVRIPFATADRNEPLIATALSEFEVAQARERQLRVQLDVASQAALVAANAAESMLKNERTRAQLLRERANLVQASFHAGETSLPELLRASSAASQAEMNLGRQQAQLGLARARLQQAYGQLP